MDLQENLLKARRPPLSESTDPVISDFLDFREYLRVLQETRKAKGRPASNAEFARRGSLESPNYWGLVLSGKRNLSPVTIHKFIKAIGLRGRDSLYFENLVYFNQSKTSDQRQIYFERLQALQGDSRSLSFQILEANVELLSNWYVVAIRELVATNDFQEDEGFIVRRLAGKVSKEEVRKALGILLDLGLLKRDQNTGRLYQSDPHLNYQEAGANFAVRRFHGQFIEMARDALNAAPVDERSMTSSTLSISWKDAQAIKKELEKFVSELGEKYGNPSDQTDSVLQLNTQIFFLTELKSRKGGKK